MRLEIISLRNIVAEALRIGSLHPKEEEFVPCVTFSASRWCLFVLPAFQHHGTAWLVDRVKDRLISLRSDSNTHGAKGLREA